jgi:AraC-like DNA-binding protein
MEAATGRAAFPLPNLNQDTSMWQAVSYAPQPAVVPRLALTTIWEVRGDPTYDVRSPRPESADWIAIRTLAGQGRLTLAGRPGLDLPPESLIVAPRRRIRRYRCPGEHWHFWWFEFTFAGELPLAPEHLLATPAQPGDDEDCRTLFMLLRRDGAEERGLAAALFSLLLHRWVAARARAERRGPHREALERVIDRMHDDLTRPLAMAELAAAAHLSERRFRQVFAAHTGKPPKRFYDELRLAFGRDLLRQGTHSVAQVADELGYSSPFHFSKAFRAHFGAPPSAFLPRALE